MFRHFVGVQDLHLPRHTRVRERDARDVESILPIGGVILERAAITSGFLAAMIAVGGFLVRAQAILRATPESTDARRPTVVGGLLGLMFGIAVIVLDLIAG